MQTTFEMPHNFELFQQGYPQVAAVGTDIVEIEDFRHLPLDSHRLFYKRVFTQREIDYCQSYSDPPERFAVRFAGKGAVIKALGGRVSFQHIEIWTAPNGRPCVNLIENSEDVPLEPRDAKAKIMISLSNTVSHALAFVMLLAD